MEIRKGAYGLPQVGVLANDLLKERLQKAGYYPTSTTPGLWRHQWRPIIFCLIVDDFGIEYIGKQHVQHLISTLHLHYQIMED